jgi:glycosyltransferase involved in cell wall biosynthesis
MCRKLSERHDVKAVTFKRLYPSILFPGKTQFDTSKKGVSFDAERLIDSLNPLTWTLAGRRIGAESPDLVIVEWWSPFFGPCMASVLSNARPKRSLFICHNVLPHESHSLAKPLTITALRKGDAFVVHAEEEAQTLRRILPGRTVERTILPEVGVFPKTGMGKEEARARLGIQGRTILFFGLVRKYKGLMDLIKAMGLLRNEKITCLVTGEFYDKKEPYMAEIDRLKVGNCIRIVDDYVPSEDVETYFAAADLVVLPYRSATQSGVVQVACTFQRPVIATKVGGLPEAVDDGRTGILVTPDDPGALARAIRRFYSESLEGRFTAAIRADEGRFSWDRVIEVIETIGASH